ncbi:uridine kinase [Bacillus sp. BHET2]|uniref:kinase n=1 Tax=Bacillus sp. BHET2 TaxID=2583818 RepID=UPI00110DBC3E|nr:kinase [Bacillus sp. BHET2]TMU87048.1 uridine kinase [Bacillus sp. BHET2]
MSIAQMAENILSSYQTHKGKNRPYIIGIDGLGGAGKTTFAKDLKHELEHRDYHVTILHIDDYIVESKKRYGTGFEEWQEYYFFQWDIELIQSELFEKLHQPKWELTLPFYDQSMDKVVTKQMDIPPSSILVIEGVFVQRKEWKSFYDFTIFIDCPREVRVERVLDRDVYLGEYGARVEKYERRYWPAEDYYMQNEEPVKIADTLHRL